MNAVEDGFLFEVPDVPPEHCIQPLSSVLIINLFQIVVVFPLLLNVSAMNREQRVIHKGSL